MDKIFEKYPHLTDSLSLPEDILDRLRIKRKKTVEDTQETPELDFKERIEKVVDTSAISNFCVEYLAKENPKALVKLIQSISRNQGDGTWESDIHALSVIMDLYGTPENHHVFKEVAEVLDGESA